MTYPTFQLRDYALIANVPAIFCLYYTNEHAILGRWLYRWLVEFVRDANPPAFHPFTLQLIKQKLPNWWNPSLQKNDYQLFLEGIFGLDPERISDLDRKIEQAISEDRVLFYNRKLGVWDFS